MVFATVHSMVGCRVVSCRVMEQPVIIDGHSISVKVYGVVVSYCVYSLFFFSWQPPNSLVVFPVWTICGLI